MYNLYKKLINKFFLKGKVNGNLSNLEVKYLINLIKYNFPQNFVSIKKIGLSTLNNEI